MGVIWKYGDNINTDVIFAGKYTYVTMEPEEMAGHALEDLDPEFAGRVKAGDVIVAGANFGCGSSREQAAICLKAAGIRAVVAKSFARIFFRNAINQGLPVLQCPEAVDGLEAGEPVEVDFASGKIASGEKGYHFLPFPPSVLGILEAGGLIPYFDRKLNKKLEPVSKGFLRKKS